MSYFMDYGDDWPPPPKPPVERPPARRPWPLRRKLALLIAAYVVVIVGVLIIGRLLDRPFDPYKPEPTPASVTVHHP